MFAELLGFLKGLLAFAGYVDGSGGFPKKLSADEERELLERLSHGDGAAAKRLVEGNLRLVAHIAKKYRAPGRDTDDLIQIGAIGLIKAVDTYTPARGRSLAAYAGRCIENEILMALRSERRRRGDVSLEEPIGRDADGEEITLGDVLGTDEDEVFGLTHARIAAQRLREKVSALPDPRERRVVALRYGLAGGRPLAQREVAAKLGISRSYVSRIEKKALGRLRRELECERGNAPCVLPEDGAQ